MLRDSSAVHGRSSRAVEGPLGTWFSGPRADAVVVGLGRREAYVLCEAIRASGGRCKPATETAPLPAGAVAFVAAARRGCAADYVARIRPRDRHRVGVVARLDTLPDALEALRLGAGALLASPLSPQQVAGAVESLVAPGERAFDAAAGLPLLRAPAHRYGLPGHALFIRPQDPSRTAEVALLLRRFLRGYDGVGADGRGGIAAVVYCPKEHLPAVVRRLEILVEGASIFRTRDTAALPRAA